MCRLNSPRNSVSTCVEIDSDFRFALVARNLVDRKAREALKYTTNNPILGTMCV
jgi:hypothetical protein